MERDVKPRTIQKSTKISTHTLTWSVTVIVQGRTDEKGDFNSHAHVERDVVYWLLVLLHEYFNSHAHVERDIPLFMI